MGARVASSPHVLVHSVSTPLSCEARLIVDVVECMRQLPSRTLCEGSVLLRSRPVAALNRSNVEPVLLEVDWLLESNAHKEGFL